MRGLPTRRAALASCSTALVALAASLPVACDTKPAAPSAPREGPPVVATTFYPTLYFVQRIAGDRVRAVCPVPEDEDPIFWQPPDDAIATFQTADLIVVNGAGFEKWVETVSLPPSRIVDTAKEFESEFIHFEDAVTHTHGPEGEHTHEGLDGHTWLDPVLATRQARAIEAALARRWPEHAQDFASGMAKLADDLAQLDAAFKALTETYDKSAVYCSHPAYNYVARRYGWTIRNLDLDPETMPSDETFAEIRAELREAPARLLLWEAEPLLEIRERFAKSDGIGLESIVVSPCELLGAAELAAGEDYLSVMRGNVERLRRVFGAGR